MPVPVLVLVLVLMSICHRRKVCNHPYLLLDVEPSPLETEKETVDKMVAASGKLTLLDRMLPRLQVRMLSLVKYPLFNRRVCALLLSSPKVFKYMEARVFLFFFRENIPKYRCRCYVPLTVGLSGV